MAVQLLPQDVADAFVKQYYVILNKCPHNLYKFYQESSLLGWPGSDGLLTPVTTISEINDKIMSSNFKDWSVEVKTADAQESTEGAVLVVVTGCLIGEDVKKNFSQTFFLAKQERGFFVLNDVLRIFDVTESIKEIVSNGDSTDSKVPAVPPPTSVSCNISENSGSSQTGDVLEHENLDEKRGTSVSNDTVAKDAASKYPVAEGAASKSPVISPEKAHPVAIPDSKAKEVPQKVSYASMVVKESPQDSPAAIVSSNADNPAAASPPTKLSSPTADCSTKILSTSSAAPKALIPPTNVAPKLPTGSNGPQSARAYPEARGIYIGAMPYDITKQGVLEVVKKFGQVRRSPDSIQIRRHEDGFCCGFVEFESADSARRAVEAHHIKFGETEAYITYKRTPNRGNDGGGRGRSPTMSGSRAGNFRGRENGEVVNNDRKFQNENRNGYGKPRAWGPRRSRSSDQWMRTEEKNGLDGPN